MLTSMLRRMRASSVTPQRGGVTIVSAIIMGAFALLASGSLHIGNWYTHRRHLQLQADAAAFAAGQRFGLCVSTPGSAFAEMQAEADKFGGFAAGAFNLQVGTGTGYSGSVARVYNSQPYPGGSNHAADPDAIPADPCTQPQMFDVKATETTIPRLFSFLPLGQVNAHARVELKAINEMKGLLPFGIPDVRPKYVFAHFFAPNGNETVVPLADGGSVGNRKVWTASPTVSIPVGVTRVQIRLVGADDPNLACGQLYTECYDTVHIRGWDSSASKPRAENVWILKGSCDPDAYYSLADCSAGIQAEVDLGPTTPVTAATRVFAQVDGAQTKYQLAPPSTSFPLAPGKYTWTLNSGLPLTDPGAHTIQLGYDTGTGGDRMFEAGGVVHAATVAEPGPIQLVQISQGGNFLANSYPSGSQNFTINVQTLGNLLLSQPADPPIYLRTFQESGSAAQNQTVDCDRDRQPDPVEEIALGCRPFYIKNPSFNCAYQNESDLWAVWYTNHQSLPCVPVKPGVGNVSDGLNRRIYGVKNPPAGACDWMNGSGVNWIRGSGFNFDAHPEDKRALPLFVTPLGSFGDKGNQQGKLVPVIDFGYFYVTGYADDPCEKAGDPNQDPVPNNRKSYVRGHFIKFFPLENVVPSDELCDFNSITPCVGVLTR